MGLLPAQKHNQRWLKRQFTSLISENRLANNIVTKKKSCQHFQSAYSQNLKVEFPNETYRPVFGWETSLSSIHPHKGLFHVLKGLRQLSKTASFQGLK